MKTLKVVALCVLAVLFTGVVNANVIEPPAAELLSHSLKADITKTIKYPNEAQHNMVEGFVQAKFMVDLTGDIKVTDISGHPSFVDSVKEQMEEINVESDKLVSGNEMIIKIIFDLNK